MLYVLATLTKRRMSKQTLRKEIVKEIERLNTTIDRKIIKGQAFEKEARHHRDLLSTLRRLQEEEVGPLPRKTRRSCRGKSPVRRKLSRGIFARVFTMHFA
jgi:hypothetical protein